MARKHEAVAWLKKGHPPSEIAERMHVTVSTVKNYLYNQVGEGKIRRSDIVFSIDPSVRDVIERAIEDKGTVYWFTIYRAIQAAGQQIHRDDLQIYLELRDARVALGDMYEMIRDVEVTLHSSIKSVLMSEYGQDHWWRQGIPAKIRVECASSLEFDSAPASEPYCYTTLIHLKEILDKQWKVFAGVLPQELSSDKQKLLAGLTRLNEIRNSVMHPVRGSKLGEDDFAFVRLFRDTLKLSKWPMGKN